MPISLKEKLNSGVTNGNDDNKTKVDMFFNDIQIHQIITSIFHYSFNACAAESAVLINRITHSSFNFIKDKRAVFRKQDSSNNKALSTLVASRT